MLLSIQLTFCLSPVPGILPVLAEEIENSDYSDTGKSYTTNSSDDEESDFYNSESDNTEGEDENQDSSDNNSPYDEEDEELEYEEDEFQKEYESAKKKIQEQASNVGGFGIEGVVKNALDQELMGQYNSGDGQMTYNGAIIKEIGEIRVDKDMNASSYRWAVWHKENKKDTIDTSDSDGNYKGFSKEKVKAWSEYESAIKKINNKQFPKLQDYKYPTTTPTQKFTFWADKPGYYDLYGDPLFDTVSLKAEVDVSYTAKVTEIITETVDDGTDDDVSAQGPEEAEVSVGPNSANGGPDSNCQLAQNVLDAEIASGTKTEKQIKAKAKDLEKTAKKQGSKCSLDTSAAKGAKGRVPTKATCNNWHSWKLAKVYDQDGKKMSGYWCGGYKGEIDPATGLPSRINNTYVYSKDQTNIDFYTVNGVVQFNPPENMSAKTGVWLEKPVTISRPQENSIDGNSTVTLAQAEIHNVYGSQLERVGIIAVGMANNSWKMEEDEFWEEEPEYYEIEGSVLKVENDISKSYGFCPKTDGDIIGGTTSFKNLVVHKKDLVHGYNEIREEDLTFKDKDDKDSDKALKDNTKNGRFVTPKIDEKLDVNNKDSKYVGRVPFISFEIKDSQDTDDTQKKKKTIKKYTSLTKQDEKDQQEEDKENEEKEAKRKEAGFE